MQVGIVAEGPSDVAVLRNILKGWLGLGQNDVAARVRYAVAVEETDAWVLSLYSEGKKDTGAVGDPKKQLERHPAWQKHKKGGKSPYEHYHALTIDFRARKKLHAAANRNRSLRLFVDSLPTDEALSDTTPESAP
jgi:hypothetical protein